MTLTTLTLFCLFVVVALFIYVIKYEKKKRQQFEDDFYG